jgi:hypothetical protein
LLFLLYAHQSWTRSTCELYRQFGNISLNAGNIAADFLHGLIELLLATARDEDVSTFSDEELCCG